MSRDKVALRSPNSVRNRNDRRWLGLTAAMASLSLSCLGGASTPAVAYRYREYAPPWDFGADLRGPRWGDVFGVSRHHARKHGDGAKTTDAVKPETPKQPAGPLILAVSIGSQRVTVYDNGTPVAVSPISSGMAGHSTPTGVFSVIQKQRWHHSNLYSNAPMPYMQRITWSGVALHAGVVPGYPASHGCIRLPEAFAVRLWGMTKVGARVVITRNEAAPYEINHPRLAGLVKTSEPAAEARALEVAPDAPTNPNGSEITTGTVVVGATVTSTDAVTDGASTPERLHDRSGLGAPLSTGTAPPPPLVERVASVDRSVDLRPTFEPSKSEPSKSEPSKSEPSMSEPPVPVPHAKPADVSLRSSPISLFVSRKEGKLFVRKGFAPVFDAPITIAQREVPLGTHVFTANPPTDGSAGVRWLAVSIGADRASAEPVPTRGKARGAREERPIPPSAEALRRAAAEALDRIELPPDVLDRIIPLVAPGASLLISDHGLGDETGRDTDFIVVTR